MVKRLVRRFICIVLALCAPLACWAGDEVAADSISVSLLIVSPGNLLYSCVGHACYRMQYFGPNDTIDNCFSYEGEDVSNQFAKFFAGDLKMGMARVPSEAFIPLFEEDGRGVKQYTLNLPIDMKRRLWQILDTKYDEGMALPYDYAERGCALTCLQFLMQAADTVPMEFAPWPEKYGRTRREILIQGIDKAPWSQFCLNTIIGTDGDKAMSVYGKVILPNDLVEVLQEAKIDGTPIISEQPRTLFEPGPGEEVFWFSPLLLAAIFLAIAILGCFVASKYVDWLLLTLQFALGCFVIYLLMVSTLPCNEWNWLVVPFNPLPLLLWRWRKYWMLVYAIVLVVWEAVMLLYPHMLTDWAYIVLTLSLLVMYSKLNIRYYVRKKIG